ncbi:sulfite oxidase [Paragonimus westermani]|uniref:sulfite oxidase n=1 Tax=Paragonimus westermani TaxID=34504 RepID=A0A5J4NIW3_9TREM|nr:sulfite oxidase [Paragonimus westermani]
MLRGAIIRLKFIRSTNLLTANNGTSIVGTGSPKNNGRKDESKQFTSQYKLITGLSATAITLAYASFWWMSRLSGHNNLSSADTRGTEDNGKRIITKEELAKHNSVESGGIWVSLQGKVYDVTEFVEQHPGGDKILLAAGADLFPYWSLYAFHFDAHVRDILKEYYIGELSQKDQAVQKSTSVGPYANDPVRHPALLTVSKEPCNSETPAALIPDHPITPNELFFVRNHLPVPDIDINNHRIQLSSPTLRQDQSSPVNLSLTVDQLKEQFPKHSIISTIICAGNRRSDMAREDVARANKDGSKPIIRGLGWKHAAASTAEWTGVRLVDLLAKYLLPEDQRTNHLELLKAAQKAKIRHVQFEGADVDVVGGPFGASLPVELALDPQMDVLLAYEMNGQPLPRDHGYPLRVVVPGSIGARQVKWLKRITLCDEESPSFYQREDYKIACPAADNVTPSYQKLPAILDHPVQSAMCEPVDGYLMNNEGSVTVRGYAFSGGGRGILSVRVSADGGHSWHEAQLHPVSPPAGIDPSDLADGDLALAHRTRQQWAWTLWDVEVPVPENAEGVELVCCARDSSNAVQPESSAASLNTRGLLSNAWHRIRIRFKPAED